MSDKFKIIQEVHRDEFDLVLKLGVLATECRLTVEPKTGGNHVDSQAIEQMLGMRGVVSGIDREAIAAACKAAERGHHVKNQLIAKGRLPSEDKDGFLEFKVLVSSDKPRYIEDDSGSIDFHSANLFENVVKDQVVAIVHDPVRAKDGATVMGHTLPCKPNTVPPQGVKYRLGKGLLARGKEIVAKMEGRVVQQGEELSISDEFLVKEDVDFDTGNIDFVGSVKINGDVVDGFRVRGKKGVVIRHNVGRCVIESDGDIELAGMTGEGGEAMGESKIRCGGNLRARYLRNVDVECDGNIEIQREAIHCNIKCGGMLVVRGTIAAGEHVAFKGIEAGVIGTALGVTTRLTAGKDFRILEKRKDLEQRIETNEKHQKTLNKLVGPYLNLRNPASMKDEFKQKLTKALRQMQQVKARHEDLCYQLSELNKRESSKDSNPKINVQKFAHPGTIVYMGNTLHEYDERGVKGAVSLIEHRGEEIMPTRMTPLLRHASQIENEVIQKETKERMAAEKKALKEAQEKELRESKAAASKADVGGSNEKLNDTSMKARLAARKAAAKVQTGK